MAADGEEGRTILNLLAPDLIWGKSDSGPTPEMIKRYGYAKARRVGRMALVGGKDKTRIRESTPPEFRDVLISIARNTKEPTNG